MASQVTVEPTDRTVGMTNVRRPGLPRQGPIECTPKPRPMCGALPRDARSVTREGRGPGPDPDPRVSPDRRATTATFTVNRPGSCLAAMSRRRALSRDQPVTPTTSSNNRPRPFFDAAFYAFACLLVISAREVIDNPSSCPAQRHGFAGIPREAPRPFRGQLS